MTNAKLYVGNLNYQASDQQVKELFSEYGSVSDVRIIEGKGFGFIQMETPEDALRAKEDLNGKEFLGRTLRVDNAKPPKRRESFRDERRDRY